jgi:copper homeostasis protein
MTITLEIAVFNYQSALNAAGAGADRIEVCDNMHEGGTTPSYGTIKQLKRQLNIPVFAMIRARGGDFLYSGNEFEVMQKDLELFKKLGCEGVVFGFLKADGTVDKMNTSRFVELAYPMEVTFHRAFDRAVDPFMAMEDIIDCGCQRILTSGQKPVVDEGLSLVKGLVEKAGERIIILPGSGVRSGNIKELAIQSGAVELHSSARKIERSLMQFTNELMQETLDLVSVDVEEIRKMKQELNSIYR